MQTHPFTVKSTAICQPNGNAMVFGQTEIPEGTVLLGFRGSLTTGVYKDPDLSDIDLLGAWIPGPEYYFGLTTKRGTWEYRADRWDAVYYEFTKFVRLLLNGNPNVASFLWMRWDQDYLMKTPELKALVRNRNWFRSKQFYYTFSRYAHSQIAKMVARSQEEVQEYLDLTAEAKRRAIHPNQEWTCLNCHWKGSSQLEHQCPTGSLHVVPHDGVTSEKERDRLQYKYDHLGNSDILESLQNFQRKGENIGRMGDRRKRLLLEFGYDTANAAHCIRLLRMCSEFLRDGEFHVYRPRIGDAHELLDIKLGKWALSEVQEHAAALEAECADLHRASSLPEEPNRKDVETLMMGIIIRKLQESPTLGKSHLI